MAAVHSLDGDGTEQSEERHIGHKKESCVWNGAEPKNQKQKMMSVSGIPLNTTNSCRMPKQKALPVATMCTLLRFCTNEPYRMLRVYVGILRVCVGVVAVAFEDGEKSVMYN